jgi:tetratricopeptide (TPR) repeat protein
VAPAAQKSDAFNEWVAAHPTNYYALSEEAHRLMDDKKYREAVAPLKKLHDSFAAPGAPRSVFVLLATAYNKLGETNAEYEVLSQLAAKDDDCTDAYLRLMQLAEGRQKWPVVEQNAQRYLAVNPLLVSPYHYLARASEELGDAQTAIGAYRVLLQLEPADPADVHYRLARALHKRGDPEARRQVLQALEEAPRYREALGLLLEINGQSPRAQNRAPTQTQP